MHDLFDRQLAAWPEAARRYRDLQNIETKEIDLGGMPVRIQFNPARAVSTLARTDAAAIKARPCFLCRENRPAQQEALPFEGCDGRRYEMLVNPFPIFPEHYTVPAVEHTPQRIAGRFPDMLRLAEAFPGMVVFYNGPESGASAPDHFHFQMGCRGFLPVETHFDRLRPVTVMRPGIADIAVTSAYIPGLPVITAPDGASATAAFLRVLRSLPVSPATGEPQLNILCWKDTLFRTLVIPRKAHRPSCYFAPEDRAVRISPASVDLGGVFIVPVEDDFRRVNAQVLRTVIEETVDTSWQPVINVGLLTAPELRVRFNQPFTGPDSREGGISGDQAFTLADGMVEWNGKRYGRLEFRPAGSAPEEGDSRGFTLHKVRIGINFHWEREEDQLFSGGLTILPSEEGLVAINSVLTEDYLLSVISSEMNGDAPEEFLKVHAVISRSWLLARPTLGGADNAHGSEGSCHSAAGNGDNPDSTKSSGNGHSRQGISAAGSFENDRIIRWYDREDHSLFDVCADDHCQRYQGLLRAGNANIRRAIEATRGLVLTNGPDGAICDTRFSKCCGGVSERFSACWADEDYAYLQPVRDYAADGGTPDAVGIIPDLSDEQNAREWILSSPEAFCNTSDPALLSTVLNSYDQETADFYRWRVEYSQEELSDLLRRRSGIDFGSVLELRPLRRGASGRIIELLIRGTLRTVTVGKELEIRRWLSESHLYSSAFVVDTVYAEPASDGQDIRPDINAPAMLSAGHDSQCLQPEPGLPAANPPSPGHNSDQHCASVPTGFILHGAGWGHGVGLCQIGAAAMSARGCTFDRILAHYFRGSCLTRLY